MSASALSELTSQLGFVLGDERSTVSDFNEKFSRDIATRVGKSREALDRMRAQSDATMGLSENLFGQLKSMAERGGFEELIRATDDFRNQAEDLDTRQRLDRDSISSQLTSWVSEMETAIYQDISIS